MHRDVSRRLHLPPKASRPTHKHQLELLCATPSLFLGPPSRTPPHKSTPPLAERRAPLRLLPLHTRQSSPLSYLQLPTPPKTPVQSQVSNPPPFAHTHIHREAPSHTSPTPIAQLSSAALPQANQTQGQGFLKRTTSARERSLSLSPLHSSLLAAAAA